MKKLVKIFVAVVALFTLSCTTDTTQELGVQLSVNGQAEITLSLEGTKTQLGEKAGDLYPLYWSEGDKISVNGVESSALAAQYAGSAVAVFNVAASAPYCIAYPAAPAGQVLFADKQVHAGNNTFGSGISTMYAYSEDGLGVQLQHLTGVLKFGVTGSAVITKAQISTIDRKPIAGAFALDFASGKLEPTEGAKPIIEYSFGDGVQLSDVPTYLHIVVPAGIYGELYVTLYDAEGYAMCTTIKTDAEKPLSVGKVREFSNTLIYAPEKAAFVIKDKESLKAWAAQAAEATSDAVMVADIDMTGENWTSVEGFAGIFRGNGYSIKGLNAPLFGTTNAIAIIGLHLEDVDIEVSNLTHNGAIACWLQQTSTSTILNCSASGKMVVDSDGSLTGSVYVGGILGRSSSTAELSGLVNDVDIEVKGTYAGAVLLSGVVGSAAAAKISNSVNLGDLIYNVTEVKSVAYAAGISRAAVGAENCINGSADDATGETGRIIIKGVFGDAVVAGGVIEISGANTTNCHNYGNIYYQGTSAAKYVQLCGLVRFHKEDHTEWTNSTNHGDIIVSGATSDSFILGGFSTRHFQTTTYSDCHNYGDIIVEESASATMVVAGGFLGTNDDTGEVCYIQNCSNSGDIKVYSPNINKVYLGGFNGVIEAGQMLVGLADQPDMVSTNSGDIIYEANNAAATVYIGGCVGIICDNLTGGVTEVTSASRLAYAVNRGNITVNGDCHTLNTGGLVGRFAKGTGKGAKFYHTLIDSKSYGNISVGAKVHTGACAIGGLYGYWIYSFSGVDGNWVNYGKLTFTGEVVKDRLLVGGFAGATDRAFSGKNNTIYNFGDIECTGKVNAKSNNRIGGIFGQTNKTCANCHVYCSIKHPGYSHVGMLVGAPYAAAVAASNCTAGGAFYEYDSDDDAYRKITLTADNFFEYLYGGETDWSAAGVTDYHGCTVLTEKPTL